MLAIHDQFTRQISDRLKTTSMGLGLMRLLHDAKRFEEARTTLSLLETGSDDPRQEHSKINQLKGNARIASSASASNRVKSTKILVLPYSVA